MTYGDHLRAKRLDVGLTRKQAAERIGVDETSVYNWESNRIEPAVRFIPQIHLFLGLLPLRTRADHQRMAQAYPSESGILTRENG